MPSQKPKLMISGILGVIIAIIAVMIYVFPATVFLLIVGYGFFVFFTLLGGLAYPKWYVKLYTMISFFWEIFWYLYMGLGSLFFWDYFGITFYLFLEIGVTLPLIPLWYLWYKYRKEKGLLWWMRKVFYKDS